MSARSFRWLRRGSIAAVAAAVLALLGAAIADRLFATEVLFISPKPDEVVQLDRALWQPGQPVAPIYGLPAEHPSRVVGVDSSALIRPVEDPSLLLLRVDRQRGDRPLQTKTVWFVASRIAAGLTLVGLLGLAAVWLRRPGPSWSPPRSRGPASRSSVRGS
jgi:hypothetical protein